MNNGHGVALLTIRVWSEGGSRDALRADVRSARDVSAGLGPSVTVTDVDEAMRVVRAFLDEVVPSPRG
jgi:hypothetical protein